MSHISQILCKFLLSLNIAMYEFWKSDYPHLCSDSSLVQWPDRGSLKYLKSKIEEKKTKKKTTVLVFAAWLWAGELLQSYATYDFPLAIDFYLHGAHTSDRCISISSSQVFSEQACDPGCRHCIMSSLVYVMDILSPYSPNNPPH